jgi:metal-sulfur cluster biosynthetic enzyme
VPFVVLKKEEILRLLNQIPDPEIPVINIVELGIVRDAKMISETEAEIIITPTYSACPAMFNIEEDIIKLFKEKGISAKVVTKMFPIWTTDVQAFKPHTESTRSQHRLLYPFGAEELGLSPILRLHKQSVLTGKHLSVSGFICPLMPVSQSQQGFTIYVFRLVIFLAAKFRMIMEVLTRWIMIATRCRMVAFTTVVSHILARLQVHISGKALLASALRADIAIGSTGMIALQNKSYIIFHFFRNLMIKKMYQSVSFPH